MNDEIRTRNRKGNVRKKILFSYFIIGGVFLVALILDYSLTYQTSLNQVEKYDRNLLKTIQGVCDNEFRKYAGIIDRIQLEKSVQHLGRNPLHDAVEDYWNDYMALRVLTADWSANRQNEYYDVFLWLKQQDKVINKSSCMSYKYYSETICLNREEWSSSLKRNLQQINGLSVIGMLSKDKNYIILIKPVMGLKIKQGDLVIGIWIDEYTLDQAIRSASWEDGLDWMLLDQDGNIVRKPTRFDTDGFDASVFLTGEANAVRIGDSPYIALTQDSTFGSLKYVLLAPEGMLDQSVSQIQRINIISIIVMIVIGCVSTFFFTKMQYAPLQDLMTRLKVNDGPRPKTNEYQLLEKHIQEITNQSRESQKNTQAIRRSMILEQLILGSNRLKYTDQQEAEIVDEFRLGKNTVLKIIKGHGSKPDGERNPAAVEINSDAVFSEILENTIGKHFCHEAFEYENEIVMIFNVPENDEDFHRTLQSELEHLKDFTERKYRLSFCILEGGMHEGLDGIRQSWLEACQTEEFIGILDETYIRYEDIKDMSVYGYFYSFDMEKAIVNMIRKGDMKAAQTIIDGILERLFKEPDTISEIRTCILYDIWGTLIKASQEQSISISMMPKLNSVMTKASLDELQVYFHDIIEEIFAQIDHSMKEKKTGELSKQILEYIRNEYANPDLNISIIAYHFHMTPTWISTAFRSQTGTGILDVIKQIRVEKAKLLLESGYSVTDVSQMVGYRNNNSFIRVFKACTGITPGQLKNENSN